MHVEYLKGALYDGETHCQFTVGINTPNPNHAIAYLGKVARSVEVLRGRNKWHARLPTVGRLRAEEVGPPHMTVAARRSLWNVTLPISSPDESSASGQCPDSPVDRVGTNRGCPGFQSSSRW